MPLTDDNIESGYILRGQNVKIGKNSKIKADEVTLGDNVIIGDNVEIICDKLVLGDNCRVGNGTVLLCPDIDLAEGCAIGNAVQCELNEFLKLGRNSAISNRVTIAGQGVRSGASLWLKNDVIIGGGGSQGPNSYLELGDNVAIMDKAFINLSEKVTIGTGTALSFGVIVLTHGAAQPLLMGYSAKFAPVTIGEQANIYINSVILPGVSIGDYSTIAACSLVNKDIPAYALASGNPARIIVKGKGNYPRPLEDTDIDELVHGVLTDYAATLKPKGLEVLNITPGDPFKLTILFDGEKYELIYFGSKPGDIENETAADITLSHRHLPETKRGPVHFDLKELKISGEPGLLAEDLRDYLRRRAVRIFNDRPFRNIPLSNLKKLKEKEKNRAAKMIDFTHQSYLSLLRDIKSSGREIKSFENAEGYDEPLVILRHDVDFSLRKALEMAQLDSEAGATSTFFILLTAPYYNPLSEEGVTLIKQITALGHECGLHYDCTGFELLTEEQRQKRIQILATTLGDAVGIPVRTIAQHKPAKSPIRQEFPLFRDAYSPQYFKDIPYISDSRKTFFYHTDVLGFIKQYKKCQLLTHPIWWNKEAMEISQIFSRLGKTISDETRENLLMEENSILAFLTANRK